MRLQLIRIVVMASIMFFAAACGEEQEVWRPDDVTIQVELPEPLSNEDVGVMVSPDSVLSVSGNLSIDTESIAGNLDDVTGIVIVIVPAVVSFDSIGGRLPEADPADLQSAQLDSAITVSVYFAEEGTADPFQNGFYAASFSIDIDGDEVTGVTGAVDLPPSIVDIILGGSMVLGARVESRVSGRLVIEVADLTFLLNG